MQEYQIHRHKFMTQKNICMLQKDNVPDRVSGQLAKYKIKDNE